MKKITYSILTVVASLALTSPLYAESTFTHQARGTSFNQNTELDRNNTDHISRQTETGLTETESARQLLGKPVVATDGTHIGKVRDMKVDSQTGRIDYVLVDKENAMGVGEDVAVAVPLGALQFTPENAMLTVDRSKLDNVPSPTARNDREYREELNSHYGIAPTFQQERTIIHQEERKTLKQ